MTTLTQIQAAIEQDPANQMFTHRGIHPLIQIDPAAKLLIISQAPSRQAQATNTYWHDPSGDRLRAWLGVSNDEFYDPANFAVMPLDFYYPGKGAHGDLPPRRAFAAKWHPLLLQLMPNIQLTLLIGQYAQAMYLQKKRQKTLTATVAHYQDYLPQYFPLVHPSPLNFGWQKRNPWFAQEVVPALQQRVRAILTAD